MQHARLTTLVIKQDGEVLARWEGYDGPIPRVGECIIVPDEDDYGTMSEPFGDYNVLSVKIVTYGILAQSARFGATTYAQRAQNYVEVQV